MLGTKQPYSHHHFLWPFRWDLLPKGFGVDKKKEHISFDERTCLNAFKRCILENKSWQSKIFDIKDYKAYNEFTYFHSYVRKSIYDTKEASEYDYETMRYYEYTIPKNSFYRICFDHDQGEIPVYEKRSIQLLITGITLHIFNTGVGILSYDLANEEDSQSDQASILLINEVGRRIYPQFLDENGSIKGTQKAFLASEISIELGSEKLFTENFESYNLKEENKQKENNLIARTFTAPKFISGLFNDNFLFHIEGTISSEKILISRVMDDRMFFLCWYGNNELTKIAAAASYKNWNWWYAFIFGDKVSKSIANRTMQEEHLLKHTYGRWSEYGTLYGMSYDSFVCLSPSITYLIKEGLPRLDVQMSTMYYQIAVLCLAQRASLLKFSAEVSNLSELSDGLEKRLSKQTKNIYWNYIQFKNKIYFREITAQIQGVEIYNRFHEIMNISSEVEMLEKKIEAIHNYLSLAEGETMNREMNWLTKIATLFLPASFIATLFGIGLVSEHTSLSGEIDWKIWSAWGIIMGIGILISTALLLPRKIKRNQKKNNFKINHISMPSNQ